MNTKCLLIAAVVGGSVLTAWGPSAAFGQCEITPVTVDDGIAEQKFGWSTAISGDYAVVGTNEEGRGTGAAYIYERDGLIWNKIGRLVPETILPVPPLLLAIKDDYGRAVAISGRVAVVGARKRDILGRTDQGAVYVFRRDDFSDEWVYQQELTALDRDAGDLFGAAVAIDGDWIVVGASGNDESEVSNVGTAYAFHFDGSTWKQARKFRAGDQGAGDIFGNAVAISGNWVIVGSERDDDTCPDGAEALNSGSVSTFFHDPAADPNAGWEERTNLHAQIVDGGTVSCDAARNANFGNSVAISGDRLVVGARNDAADGVNSGSAYVYRLEEPDWVIEQKLTASDGAALNNFGRSVAIHGDLVLVGASKGDLDDPTPIEDTGSAYLYRRAGTSWTEASELTASDAASSDRFGWYVSIGGEFAAIGAYRKNDSTGSAYIFAIVVESDCNKNGVLDDCEVFAEPSLDSNNNDTLDSCECAIDDDCAGALACISGTCDQNTLLCLFAADPGFCAIRGVCFDNGALNPDNDCLVCDSVVNESDWSNRDEGLPCGDLSGSTCDHPDACDGEGLCHTNPEPAGTACADDGNECTNDQCDGAGACSHP
ncbi:MAG: FG-GAP repeat protein, partial [Planctomycetes bacterium]|nr:FG-GAP repeat protein [Planctomycetota bacterium]